MHRKHWSWPGVECGRWFDQPKSREFQGLKRAVDNWTPHDSAEKNEESDIWSAKRYGRFHQNGGWTWGIFDLLNMRLERSRDFRDNPWLGFNRLENHGERHWWNELLELFLPQTKTYFFATRFFFWVSQMSFFGNGGQAPNLQWAKGAKWWEVNHGRFSSRMTWRYSAAYFQ